MAQDPRNASPSRTGKPGGGDRRDGRPRGPGHGKGGYGRNSGGDSKPTRVETYETVREVLRGPDFRIDKFVAAEKATHKPIRTEYRLTREGLAGTHTFSRLADAQKAATDPLPEPEPEIEIEAAPAEEATETEAAEAGPEAAAPEEPAA
jgi:hypothetical protein